MEILAILPEALELGMAKRIKTMEDINMSVIKIQFVCFRISKIISEVDIGSAHNYWNAHLAC
jgi:hypothetical protein